MKNLIFSLLGVSNKIDSLTVENEKLKQEIDSIRQNEESGDFPRKLIYTDKAGNEYYTYVGNDMPNIRKGIVMSQIESMRFGIEPDALIDNLGKLNTDISNLNPKNVDTAKVKIISELSKLQEKTAYILQPNLFLKTANCMVLLKDEPDTFENEWAKKKWELWEKDKDAQYFFLCWVGMILDESRNWSITSVSKYLEEKQLKIQNYKPMI